MSENQPRTIVKQVDHATLYSDGVILIKEVRASYPHVFEPYRGNGADANAKPKYGIVGLMPKKKAYFAAKDLLKGRIDELIAEAKLKGLPAAAKFLRDGDLAGKEEYEGMFTINASEVITRRPQVRGNVRDPKTKKPVILKPGVDDDAIQPGYWVNLLIRPWYQNNTFGKKVNASLIAVQLVREDAVFGGQSRITSDEIDEVFDEFADDDDSGYSDSLAEDDEL